jgi:redox-sensitive bicupin YhaK (pirin superfamily)
MSWNPALDPDCPTGDAVDSHRDAHHPARPRSRRFRGAPRPARPEAADGRPFIFFDQMGPAEFLPSRGMDVRPHPHIGLATISYLYRGRMHHRDSLGTDAWIEPGAVNWMVAGHGITHSERTDDATQVDPMPFFGIQTWVALPKDHEDSARCSSHARKGPLPLHGGRGQGGAPDPRHRLWRTRAGADGVRDVLPDAMLEPGAKLPMPDDHEDRGVYVVEGSVEVAGDDLRGGADDGVPPRRPRVADRRRRRARASCSWVARRWRGRATSGGTSSPRRRSASRRPRKRGAKATGSTAGSSSRRRTTRTSSRCRIADGKVLLVARHRLRHGPDHASRPCLARRPRPTPGAHHRGGSRGIGLASCRRLAAHPWRNVSAATPGDVPDQHMIARWSTCPLDRRCLLNSGRDGILGFAAFDPDHPDCVFLDNMHVRPGYGGMGPAGP